MAEGAAALAAEESMTTVLRARTPAVNETPLSMRHR